MSCSHSDLEKQIVLRANRLIRVRKVKRIYVSRGKVEETTQTTFPQPEDSMKILAVDLGKYNSVACLFDTTPNQSEFETITTQRWAFEQLLNQTQPDQIVIESI